MAGKEGVEEDLVQAVVDRMTKINEEQFKSMMETMNANMMSQFKVMMANTTMANQMASVTEPTVEEGDEQPPPHPREVDNGVDRTSGWW